MLDNSGIHHLIMRLSFRIFVEQRNILNEETHGSRSVHARSTCVGDFTKVYALKGGFEPPI